MNDKEIAKAWSMGVPAAVICEQQKITFKELTECRARLGLADRRYEPKQISKRPFPVGTDQISQTIALARKEAARLQWPVELVFKCWEAGFTPDAVLTFKRDRDAKLAKHQREVELAK